MDLLLWSLRSDVQDQQSGVHGAPCEDRTGAGRQAGLGGYLVHGGCMQSCHITNTKSVVPVARSTFGRPMIELARRKALLTLPVSILSFTDDR